MTYPHLTPDDWSRARVVRELQDEEWWAVAEDVADGLALDTVLNRLTEIGEDESSATEIINAAIAGGVR